MKQPENISRRTVVKSLGTAAVGGTVLTGTAAARGNLVSKINSSGHYAYFPGDMDLWGRSKNPFDIRQGDSRWMTKPDAGGSVRCLVTNLPLRRNAGFDVHVGRLGDLQTVTIDAETVRTTRTGGTGVLGVGLYLDADNDGEFFAWNDGRGNTDTWDSIGTDSEGLAGLLAAGGQTIDSDTSFVLLNVGSGPNPATLGELQAGEVDGVDGETIDGDTEAAFYFGALSAGGGTEEVIISSVTVEHG